MRLNITVASRLMPWSWQREEDGHRCARTRVSSAPYLPDEDLRISVIISVTGSFLTLGLVLTFLSPALILFHSSVMSFADSPSEMPLKSPLSRLSMLNFKYAEFGLLIWRSSWIGESPLPDGFLPCGVAPLRLSCFRALLAFRICSGV